MRWGNKGEKGCRNVNCTNLHPVACPASLDLSCTNTACTYKIHVYKCKRFDPNPDPGLCERSAGAGSKQTQGTRRQGTRSRAEQSDRVRPSGLPSRNTGTSCACASTAPCNTSPGHAGTQPRTSRGYATPTWRPDGAPPSTWTGHHNPGVHEPVHPAAAGTCQGQQVYTSPTTVPHAVGFQPLTVQPVLEAWVEGIKKDMLLRQELMFQMLRTEMLQARPPMGMGRSPHGLYPSY